MLKIICTRRSGPFIFYIPLQLITDWPSKILNPFNIYSSLGRRINVTGRVACKQIMPKDERRSIEEGKKEREGRV